MPGIPHKLPPPFEAEKVTPAFTLLTLNCF